MYLLFIFSKEIRQVVAVAGNGNFNFFFRLGDELSFCPGKGFRPFNVGNIDQLYFISGIEINFSAEFEIRFGEAEIRNFYLAVFIRPRMSAVAEAGVPESFLKIRGKRQSMLELRRLPRTSIVVRPWLKP